MFELAVQDIILLQAYALDKSHQMVKLTALKMQLNYDQTLR